MGSWEYESMKNKDKTRKISIHLSDSEIKILQGKVRILHRLYTDAGKDSIDPMDKVLINIGKQVNKQLPETLKIEEKKEENNVRTRHWIE
jgi:hypothetical protein